MIKPTEADNHTSAVTYLSECRERGIEFFLAEGQLKYRGMRGLLTGNDFERIRALKTQIIEIVRSAGAVRPPLVAQERGEFPALSFAQERLWFLEELGTVGTAYHMPHTLSWDGSLDVEALERSLEELRRRHESLRTRFGLHEGVPYQVIDSFDGWPLPIEDLSGFSAEERQAQVQRRIGEEERRPFDLAAGPLIRALLLRLSAEKHVLVLAMHHIISDAWSMDVFWTELRAIYEAFQHGKPSPLPPLPIQYADYAIWQRNWLQGQELERQLRYWKGRLSGAPAALQLPLDYARPAVANLKGAVIPLRFSAQLRGQLHSLAQREQATLFMVLLAAFQALLARYSGQEDVVVGSPIAGRTHRQVEGLIGFFVNTLALRTDVSGDPSFTQLLGRVQETALGAYANQDLPFEKLVAELQPERHLSRQPIFQAMLVQHLVQAAQQSAGASQKLIEWQDRTALFDLTLHITDVDGRLVGELEYSTELFERQTAERMTRHFKVLLEGIVADPQRPLSELQLLSEAERQQLFDFNQTTVSYPQDKCLHELFEEQVERTPDAIAVVHEDQSLTYDELNCRANQLAHRLINLGVRPDERVAICLERGPQMIVALLAVLKAGGAYVPLDPGYPAERLTFVLRDVLPQAVITQEAFKDILSCTRASLILLGNQPGVGDIQAHWSVNPRLRSLGLTPLHCAYIIYTSGSTGAPKGVVVEHRNVLRLFAATRDLFHFNNQDIWTLFHSFAFDFSVWEIWGALLYGGRLVIVPYLTARSPETFHRLLCDHGVTVLNQTPSAFAQLINASAESSDKSHSLRLVIFGGEALEPSRLRPWLARNDVCKPQLVNMYGITETTVHVTYRLLSEEDIKTTASSMVGRPLLDLQVYLLDLHLQPVPIGVAGEIYVGGAGVARGYWNRPELTAERFRASPFVEGDRLYKTGDVGRYRVDGNIEYLGRNDQQVKIRGFRIELGEIEAQLIRYTGVREATVLVREDEPEDRRLVAYITAQAGTEVSTADLREHLSTVLPSYMVPAAYVQLAGMPLTPNGKLDRKALPAPDISAYTSQRYEAPRGEVEQVVAGIWRQILGVSRVGRHDDFFELGGHSQLVMRVVMRLREWFEVEVMLRTLFEAPTLAEFSKHIEALRREAREVRLPPLVVQQRGEFPALSFAQERLWFLEKLGLVGTAYHMSVALSWDGLLDVEALERSLEELRRRHESLRTRFGLHEGVPYQVIDSFDGWPLPIEDLSGFSAEERPAQVQRRIGEEERRPYDLAAGPLVRALLLRLSAEEHVLLLAMHHIISDGWSMDVFGNELRAIYEAFRHGKPSPLPPLPIQYADYAIWQRNWLQGQELERQLRYWKGHLSGAPAALLLPLDYARPAVASFKGAVVPLQFSAQLSGQLHSLAQREQVTLFMVLLAAFQALLARYSGQEDVVVGSPIAGRTHRQVEGLIGFFVNTLALRTDVSGDPSFTQLLGRVQETALGAYAHQDLPFEKLVAEFQPERHLSRQPIFQAMLMVQHLAQATQRSAGASQKVLQGQTTTAKFDLTLFVRDEDGRLWGDLEYSTELFERQTVERMTKNFKALLEGVVADPQRPLSELRLLSEAERQQPSDVGRF